MSIERQFVKEHMMVLFDTHFRPALQRLSLQALRILIFGLDALSNEDDRAQIRQEIDTFLEDLTNSGQARGILEQGRQQRAPRTNVEE